MKIIEQSHEILRYDDPLKLIEAAGRTCYKSEDKITEDSAARFAGMLTKAGHYSVLEHANAVFEVKRYVFDHIGRMPYSQFINRSQGGGRTVVSANFRAWLEFFEKYAADYKEKALQPIKSINIYLSTTFPEVFTRFWYSLDVEHKLITEDQMTTEEKLVHATRTVRFITNRGVTHELVRHRPWAYSQESTRYVKYDGNMEFILPVWLDPVWVGDWSDYREAMEERFGRDDENWMRAPTEFIYACKTAESQYQVLLSEGWKPEQAREVLPNALKTEIVCTATLGEWKHMLEQRTSPAAHPQIRALMTPVLDQFKQELPEIFMAEK